jgi:hypothetical protein
MRYGRKSRETPVPVRTIMRAGTAAQQPRVQGRVAMTECTERSEGQEGMAKVALP